MNIKLTAEAKKYITVAEMPTVRQMIKDFKDDESDIKDYGRTAAIIASGNNGNYEILKASAEIAKNQRVYNQYSDESGTLDIWMEFYAYDNYFGFYEIGVYLSDLWQADGDTETYERIKSHMFIQEFKKER